jgi:signal transduction histidine kinase
VKKPETPVRDNANANLSERQQAGDRLSRLDEIQTLHEINRTILGSLDLNKMMEGILDKTMEMGGFDIGLIRLLDAAGQTLQPSANRGYRDPANVQAHPQQIERYTRGSATARIIMDKAVHVVDLTQREGLRTLRREGVCSLVVVPLRTEQQMLGLMQLGSRKPRSFHPDELRLLDRIGIQTGIAVQKAKLYEQTQAAKTELELTNRRLERLLEDQSRLYAVLAPLAPADSLNQILERVMERILAATGADAALIKLQDRAKEAFFYAAQRGFPESFLNAERTRSPGSPVEKVFATGDSIIVSNIATDSRVREKVQLQAGFRSCAFLPLKVGAQVRGVVLLSSRSTDHFSESQRDHLMAIVRQTGIALENRELFDEINNAKLELERSNTDLEQFAYVASHDLQEPLRMVAGYTQLLAKRYQGKLDADADQYIRFIVDGAAHMQGLIKDLLAYSRLGSREEKVAVTDCEIVLQTALAALRAPIQESGAVVTHDPLPTVTADEFQLLQLLQNLIGNAIKFHNAKPPEIHVSCRRDGQQWIFSVKDNGLGIEPRHFDRIFVIFQRLHSRQDYPGTGIGLALCKKIVERHGGRIWVESKPGTGSTFYFSLLANPPDCRKVTPA